MLADCFQCRSPQREFACIDGNKSGGENYITPNIEKAAQNIKNNQIWVDQIKITAEYVLNYI